MLANFGFGCRVFVRRGIKSIASAKMEVENSMDAAKVKTNEIVDSILKHESSYVDVPQEGELIYILVINNRQRFGSV